MQNYTTIIVSARRYIDADDCLAAAADAYAAAHPDVAGYDMNPRWADDDRTMIALDVPTN